MSIHEATVIRHSPERVVEWFANPGAFARLAPPWLPAHLLSPAASLRDGTAVLGLPFGLLWVARHQPEGFVRGRRFEDRSAIAGLRSVPMGLFPWTHVHGFDPAPGGHVLMSDTIHTPVPAAVLRPMIKYRQRQVAWDLARHAEADRGGMRPMVIALAGCDAAVGQAVEAFLSAGGHRVIRLVHHAACVPNERQWHPHAPTPGLLDGCDGVVSWGQDRETNRQILREASRSGLGVAVLGSVLARPETPPDADADADAADLPDAAGPAPAVDSPPARPTQISHPVPRVVRLRAAPVLGHGAKERLMLRRGTAPSGPWIGLDDLVDLVHRGLWDAALSGTLVAAAPSSLPEGEMDAALSSSGHRFRYPELSAALRHTLGRESEDQMPNATG